MRARGTTGKTNLQPILSPSSRRLSGKAPETTSPATITL